MLSQRYTPPNDANLTFRDGQAAPVMMMTPQDYPPARPVIPKFDGDPVNYWPFICSFETHIAQKMTSDSAKLVYLLQHRSLKLRQILEHFARDADSGYGKARESLFNDFGQPHIIANCCEQKLLNTSRLKTKEPQGLKTLVISIEKSLAMLVDIQDFATLNSLGTIRRLIDKLPDQMQVDWAKWSYCVFKETGQQAKFSELVQFVRNESDEVNSLYGKLVYGSRKYPKEAAVFSTASASKSPHVEEDSVCPYCKGCHKLSLCKKFGQLGRYRRMSFVAKGRRCFKCLEVGHMMQDCESTQSCEVEGCTEGHHTLLHKFVDSHEKDYETVMCGATGEAAPTSQRKGPFFMTVPVKVRYGENEVLSYALLDSGSQRTFCSKKLAKELKAEGPREMITLSTLSSGSRPKSLESKNIFLSVKAVDEDCSTELSNVLVVNEIPLKASSMPTKDQLEKFDYLRGFST